MTSLRLVPPAAPPRVPELDAHQRAALAAVADGGHHVVVGEPGSGATTVAAATALEAVAAGTPVARVLVLAATRASAARLRDRVSLLLDRPVGAPVVRTAASASHAILTALAVAAGQPPPRLVTGAEQDQILRELLDGHARGEGAAPDWKGVVPPEATALAGFRHELRDVIMRASEAGRIPDELAELGCDVGRPEWEAAAEVMREYDQVLGSFASTPDQGDRFDPAVVVAQAAHVLRSWEELAEGEAPAWDLVVVDEAQELTAAGVDLLRACAARGARLVLLGNADASVQGYRGAMPRVLDDATAPAPRGWGARLHRLGPSHRQAGALAAVTAAATARIRTVGEGSPRGRAETVDDARGTVRIVTAAHRHAQSRAIAGALRAARHGLDGNPPVAWGEMAVIARSTSRLRELRADLAALDIPCETLGEGTALHLEPAVAPLLTLMRRAASAARGDRPEWTEEQSVELLTSRIVGLDPVALRRLRRALVRVERESEGTRGSAELLVDAMAREDGWAAVRSVEARIAERATRALADATEAARRPGSSPGTVAWAAWAALGVADSWRAAALAGSARDDADLDAVIALLRAAQGFAERMPHASVASFVEHLEGQDFAADSLGARARVEDAVAFSTAASASGREWDVVVVAGLEEGVWPDLRLRDSVLGAQHLADVLAGRAERAPIPDGDRAVRARESRRAVLDDETRAFAVAVSRARRMLILSCEEGEDARPSRYLAWCGEAAGVRAERADDIATVADLRGAVAHARVAATDPGLAPTERDGHAALVARLADAGVAGADPREWHGVPPTSSSDGMWDDGTPVRVSPSKLESLETCALRWALQSVGGTPSATEKQTLGTVVHEIAAELPHGTAVELLDALEERWGDVAGTETWPDRRLRERAEDMVRRLAGYVATVPGEVRVEQPFAVDIGGARLAGSADRVEVDGAAARIVDLKTGSPVTQKEAEEHAQLAMYQLAAAHGAFPGVDAASGASLVFLGTTAQAAGERAQPPVDLEATRARLADAVEVMARPEFLATPNPSCTFCPVRRSCPAWPEGRQVSDG
ncbi:UrvD/REP family ATP-dependent DNA helicase [Demequina lignilytica]|uniref:DNA 3'-5' helicase n=1 Tax=Demequina lignilytica TaxID=3051663 RepID=A0AB35MFZ1_9MICO|nr:UrvD/REP family ATP-dependent DNA helicase [Demequina sp. SYSU T0a273]MDN4482691.1 PD-(D/E)XK nuclease family protein [Demequina sp. SYSU T0a273]